MIISIWKYRKFIWQSAARDLWYRYAGSSIGFLWNVINPLFQIGVYTIVFSQLIVIRIPDLNAGFGFAIYLCAGLIPWFGFSETVNRCTNSFVENANYLRKLAIPEQVFVAKNAVSSFLGLMIGMTLLVAVCTFLGHYPAWSWISMPLILILLQGFGFGLGLFLGVLNAFFRDIGQVVSLFLQLWFWATPIVYTKEILPMGLQNWLYLNPVYPFICSLQSVIVSQTWPAGNMWMGMIALSFFFTLLGYFVLRELRPELRDVL